MAERERAASPAALVQLISAFRVSRALHVTAALGIADLLAAGPRPAADLAAATGTHPRALYRLLRAVASAGVLTEDGAGAFALTDLGQFLRADDPQSVRALAVWQHVPAVRGTWQHLRHSVTTGDPAFRHLHGVDFWAYFWAYQAQHPAIGALFDANMTGQTLQLRDAVVAGYHFSGVGTVVDVAGAGPPLDEAGVADRCAVVGGDFFAAVPAGGDVYLLKRILHDRDDAQAAAICAPAGARWARRPAPSWSRRCSLPATPPTPASTWT